MCKDKANGTTGGTTASEAGGCRETTEDDDVPLGRGDRERALHSSRRRSTAASADLGVA